MQIGERLGVIEPFDLRHEASDKLKQPVDAVGESADKFVRVGLGAFAALIEPTFRPRGVLAGWEE
jgi:hypothetical protein